MIDRLVALAEVTRAPRPPTDTWFCAAVAENPEPVILADAPSTSTAGSTPDITSSP